MALSAFLSALLGGGLVLIANHLQHRQRLKESKAQSRRVAYVRLLTLIRELERDLARADSEDDIDTRFWNERIEQVLAELDVIASSAVIEAAMVIDGLFSRSRHPSRTQAGGPMLVARSMLVETFPRVRDAVRRDMGEGKAEAGFAGRY